MAKEESKVKKLTTVALKALGILAMVWLAFFLAQGKSLRSGSKGETQTNYSSYGYSGTPDYVYEDSSGSMSAPAPSRSANFESAPVSKKSSGATSQTVAPEPRKVVKDGSLEMLVKKAEESAEKIKAIALELDGFVDDVNIKNVSETSKSGTVIIRVPADNFDEALAQIKKLAVKVDKESVKATDVTEEFVDLEARLKNLKAQEAQYLKILDQAKKIEDILNVSNYLTSVRSDIERMEGRMKYLSSQVDMSSITVFLTEEGDVQLFGIRWRPLFVLKQAVRNMLTGLSGFADSMIALIFFLPTMILWLAVFVAGLWAARKIYRRVKHKFFSK
jgi:hypothetical protein